MADQRDMMRGKVALVTGASRGIGKGIAKILCQAGAVVYITGRKLGDSSEPFTLSHTAKEISAGGMTCIPVQCDHGNEEDVKQLFDRISAEQDDCLDVLVNNAFAGVEFLMSHQSEAFFEQPLSGWEKIFDVGTKSDYVAAWYAARMMVKRKTGLIVNISSPGGLFRIFKNIPYGVGKEAIDRMSLEMGVELKEHKVACISLWPGAVKTETIVEKMKESKKLDTMFRHGEDPTFTGKCIVELYNDKDMLSMSGKILLTGEMAYKYGLKDVDGHSPLCILQPKSAMLMYYPSWAWLVPSWLFLPRWVVALKATRF